MPTEDGDNFHDSNHRLQCNFPLPFGDVVESESNSFADWPGSMSIGAQGAPKTHPDRTNNRYFRRVPATNNSCGRAWR
jgi:hypothetical protein